MAAMTKPTVIFVPGAWHNAEHFATVAAGLEKQGYPCERLTLPSVGAEPPLKDFEKDVQVIRQALDRAIEQDQKIILFVHSYGGVPASQALEGFPRQGAIIKMIFCCSFVLPEGQCLMTPLAGQSPPWMESSGEYCWPKTPADTFYNDLSEEAQGRAVALLSKTHSFPTFWSVLTHAGWRDVPGLYLFTKLDATLPYEAQIAMVESCGKDFEKEALEAGHSPFLSVPLAVITAIRRAAGEKV